MNQLTFTLFLDESGDNILYRPEEYVENPKLETHCTLMGTIVPHDKKSLLKAELEKVKINIFRSKEVVLHSVEVRNKTGTFCVFHYNPNLYREFKNQMNNLVTTIKPIIICSSLNKKRWVEVYPRKLRFKDDPYEQAFIYLLERYAHFLNTQKGDNVVGYIEAESRGENKKQNQLIEVYQNTRKYGTQYFDKPIFFSKLAINPAFYKKNLNIPGLQLSDYFSYPFYINHKFPKRDNKHYEFLEQFIYPGDYGRYGYKKWPI